MITFFKSFFLSKRFYQSLVLLAVLFMVSQWFPVIYLPTWILLVVVLFMVLTELIALYKTKGFKAERLLTEKFSNSDENPVEIHLFNQYGFSVRVEVIDEIPEQFQKRDFLKEFNLSSNSSTQFIYTLTPKQRGEYYFGALHCFVSTATGLIKRRYSFNHNAMVKVYPSYIQMQALAFMALDKNSALGLKKVRRIGHTLEFEQIKEYVLGDDMRTINWKATAKHDQLMVNQYQEERSQPIYNVIDRGRLMKMPFEHLTLLDYAINTSLAFSNIALKKKDKVGMLSFAENIKHFTKATDKPSQLRLILERLYNLDTHFLDSDFGRLYTHIKTKISQRSLLILYTNFEHKSSLERQLPYLRALNKKHVLVVVLFQNTEVHRLAESETINITSVYEKTIAQQFNYEKELMRKTLMANGIQCILTKPENLSINTINKYLEIKAKGLL